MATTTLNHRSANGSVDISANRPPAGHTAVERLDAVVIGGGQAGLATGYHLARHGLRFAIFDAHDRVGDTWRERWDSLRLFSPARYDALPGMRFPGDPSRFPTALEMADYLEGYAAEMRLPVRSGTRVERVMPSGEGFRVLTSAGAVDAGAVVVAIGAYHRPRALECARELDPGIVQIHSSDYRNPGQVPAGPVLVVGASTSGSEIAQELALAGHRTYLAGRHPGQIPFRIDGPVARVAIRGLWFAWNHVLTNRTPVGRRMREQVRHHGGPLIRVRLADLERAGVERFEQRVTGAMNGKPMLEDGRVLDVIAVVSCVGFRPDYGWIDGLPVGEDGYPIERDGSAPELPGLHFVGLKFQRAFASMLVGGAGRDAAAIAGRIAASARRVA